MCFEVLAHVREITIEPMTAVIPCDNNTTVINSISNIQNNLEMTESEQIMQISTLIMMLLIIIILIQMFIMQSNLMIKVAKKLIEMKTQ